MKMGINTYQTKIILYRLNNVLCLKYFFCIFLCCIKNLSDIFWVNNLQFFEKGDIQHLIENLVVSPPARDLYHQYFQLGR